MLQSTLVVFTSDHSPNVTKSKINTAGVLVNTLVFLQCIIILVILNRNSTNVAFQTLEELFNLASEQDWREVVIVLLTVSSRDAALWSDIASTPSCLSLEQVICHRYRQRGRLLIFQSVIVFKTYVNMLQTAY